MKQGVIDALSKDNRLVDDTLPLFFFEADQRRLSFKGAAKVCGRLGACWMVPTCDSVRSQGNYGFRTHLFLIHCFAILPDRRSQRRS